MKMNHMNRRAFISTSGTLAAGTLLAAGHPTFGASLGPAKKRIALVGTGGRGTGFWGKNTPWR